MDPDSLPYLATLVVSLLVLGFSATAEVALGALSRGRFQRLLEQGREIDRITSFIERPSHYVSACQITRTASLLAVAGLGALVLERTQSDSTIKAVLVFVGVVVVILVGHIIPRSLAIGEAEETAFALALPIVGLTAVLSPLVKLSVVASNWLARFIGHPPVSEGTLFTPEELRVNLAVAEEEGLIEEDERDMIDGIFGLEDTAVREIMVSRMDLTALEETTPVGEAVDVFVRDGFSRLPVYRQTIDDVTGILYAKDLFPTLRAGKVDGKVGDHARPAYFVPESKKVADLLHDMQQRKVHIAIVVDEYGGTAGLVTIEDLLEEIVGEIRDEFDQEDEEHRIERTETGAICDATVSIDDVNDALDLHLQSEDVDTIGGLVYETLGRVPLVGDRIDVGDVAITVVSTMGRRIKTVKVDRVSVAGNEIAVRIGQSSDTDAR